MKLIPPPPVLDTDGRLRPTVSGIRAQLVAGVVSGCVMCGGSTSSYWPHEGRFHPLDASCATRLIEHWRTMMDSGEDGAQAPVEAAVPAGLTGAYARRARRAAANTAAVAPLSRAVAARIPDAVRANPFWMPGMAPDAPWIVSTETTIGRQHTLCGADEERARAVLARSRGRADLDDPTRPGVVVLGAALLAPDATIATGWGEYGDPFGDPLFRPLTQVGGGAGPWGWERCRGCSGWLWPGRWVVAANRHCRACAAPEDGGRPWPEEPGSLGGRTEPPPLPKKKSAKKDSSTFD